MNPRHLAANLVSLSRIVLMIPFVIFFYEKSYMYALLTTVLAVSTDYIDGQIARKSAKVNPFGAWIDPLADACVMLCSLTLFTLEGRVPLWFGIWVICRYVSYAWIAVYQRKNGLIIQSSLWNKMSIGFFAAYFFSILLSYMYHVPKNLEYTLLTITCLLQLISLIQAIKACQLR